MINLSDDLSDEENTLIFIDLTTGKVKKIFWVPIWVLKKEKPTTGVGFRGVLVPGAGIEPARTCIHWFLRPTRLPSPPSGQLFLPILQFTGFGFG